MTFVGYRLLLELHSGHHLLETQLLMDSTTWSSSRDPLATSARGDTLSVIDVPHDPGDLLLTVDGSVRDSRRDPQSLCALASSILPPGHGLAPARE
jgi:hypothetical protein